MARSQKTVDPKKVKVLVRMIKLECKPLQVRVRNTNLKVKSVCVRLQKIKVKVRNVKVNLKSVVIKKHVKRMDQNPITCSLKKNLVRILYDKTPPNIVDCLVKGTRSSTCSSNPTFLPPYVNYELGSQKSVEEDVKRKDQNQVTCSVNKNLIRMLNDEAPPMIVDCLVKGKGTRLPICSIKTTIIPPYVNYELGSQKSIEEDDEENPKKRVPDWAQESSVMRVLPNMVDPDHIFEICEPPDLLDMFPYPATTSTRRDICNSPVQSNIIDSTYVVSEESFVAVDCLDGLHNETYVVSKKYQKGESFSDVVNGPEEANATKNKEFHVESWSDEEEENEVTFDFSIRDPVEFTSSNYA